MYNKRYVLTGIGTCGVILYFYVFTTLIGQLVAPYGITEQEFVIEMGLFVFGFGIPGGIIFSIVLTKYPTHMMKAAFFIRIASIATLIMFFIATVNADKTLILASCATLGFFLLPILFVAYELAVE